jgi:hypothetical protein
MNSTMASNQEKTLLLTCVSDISNGTEYGALLNRALKVSIRRDDTSICNVTFVRCEHYNTELGSSQSPALNAAVNKEKQDLPDVTP